MKKLHWYRVLDFNGGDYQDRINQISKILISKRGYVFEPPMDEIVVILLSGGMDSVVLVDLAIRNWNCRVILLYFKRDSRNEQWEEQSVDYFYKFYKSRYPDNILELIKLKIQIPSRINKEYLDRERKEVLGLPMRNATMWC
ncbi:MAG: hypothetical protein ACTSRA_11535, partial [Promethearchaeota archaeon]